MSHPIVGASWEAFIIENIISLLGRNVQYSFYRSSNGAEIDFVLEFGDEKWAIETNEVLFPKQAGDFTVPVIMQVLPRE